MKGKCLVLMALWTVGITTVAAQSFSPPAPQSFADLLGSGGNDLVVTGTVVTAEETVRGFADGCGYENLSHVPVTEIGLRVGRIVYGVAEDSILHITILDQNYGLLPGREVVVWAHRSCPDAWRLRGYMGVIEGNEITHGSGRPIWRNSEGQVRRVAFTSIIPTGHDRGQVHSTELYNGVESVALVKVQSIDSWSANGATYHVQFVNWLIGHGSSTPTRINFPRLARCFPGVTRGDTLLVPLKAGFSDSTLVLSVCPSALRTKNGFAPGLGVQVTAVDRALMTIGQRRWLRAFQQREVK